VVYGDGGQSVYVGGSLLTMATKVLTLEGGMPCVLFRKAADGEERTLEEEQRAARSLRLLTRG
jgi:hypothetical protein